MAEQAARGVEGAWGSIGWDTCGVGSGTAEMMRPTGAAAGMGGVGR